MKYKKNIILGKPFKNCDICYIEGGRVKIRTNIILVKNVPLKTNKVSNKLKFKKCICIQGVSKKTPVSGNMAKTSLWKVLGE